jgi:hypothetical protein|tara:strand:+ start:4748 stop:5146 length:399 start_codon:yes stop_codon:yes gene_type:complete
MQTLNHLPILLSGIIVGMIMMQVSIVAPAIFKLIAMKDAGPFLRSVFPKLFLSVLILSIISFLFIYFYGSDNKAPLIASLVTAVAMAICYVMVPATNTAKDSGNENLFKKLHSASVLLTVIALIVNLGWNFF